MTDTSMIPCDMVHQSKCESQCLDDAESWTIYLKDTEIRLSSDVNDVSKLMGIVNGFYHVFGVYTRTNEEHKKLLKIPKDAVIVGVPVERKARYHKSEEPIVIKIIY